MKSTSLKLVAAAMFAASAVTMAPVFALDAAGLQVLTKSVTAAKVVEVPAVAAKLVTKASKEDKEQVAVAVVTAAIKAFPASVGSVVTAVIRSAPQTCAAVVKAALEAAPDSALTIVSAAAAGAPEHADKAVAEASKKMPSRTASFEREVAVVKGRRLITTGAADRFTDTGYTVGPIINIKTGQPFTITEIQQAFAETGADPSRN